MRRPWSTTQDFLFPNLKGSFGWHFWLHSSTSFQGSILFYIMLPKFWKRAGLGIKRFVVKFLSPSGSTNLIFTLVGMYLIDRLRKINLIDNRLHRVYNQSRYGLLVFFTARPVLWFLQLSLPSSSLLTR
jgi:hypothetical protein